MNDIIIALVILLGSIFMLIAAIGLIRFDDLYSRMHATTKATSFGLLLLIIGVSIFFNSGIVWLKAVMVIIFIYLTAPLAAHSIAKSDDKKKSG
ncbi:MAG: monovalent cation/H(+) antiporter subunit G [Flavobacteriaceae bacterium]|nr:monovalent cation/H(+) antiporter subunit G [Flavobacteriaceae bacterium]